MAKIKLTGHASGTGVLTVTAPNTSTDRTITLPDSTGTLLDNTSITDNGDATSIVIDSSEKVSIGGSGSVSSDSQVAIKGGNLELTTAGAKYWIPRASDGVLTGSLYSPSGSVVRLSGAGTSAGTIEFEPRSSNGVIARVTGDGLCFGSDTAAANALDDFETGTWTPNFVASGLSVSYNTQVGKYTKIGNAVICTLEINTSDISGDGTNNQLKITGIPFTPVTNSGGFAFGGTYGFDEAPAVAQFSGSDILLIDPSGNWSVANDLSDGNDKNHTYSSFVFTTAS